MAFAAPPIAGDAAAQTGPRKTRTTMFDIPQGAVIIAGLLGLMVMITQWPQARRGR